MSTRINPNQVISATIQENGNCRLWTMQPPGTLSITAHKWYSPKDQDKEAYEHCINMHSYFKTMVEPKK